jgi:hypothetical protein
MIDKKTEVARELRHLDPIADIKRLLLGAAIPAGLRPIG